jgi:hypothetical protein
MSAYPPEWQIHCESDFESYHLAPGEDAALSMTVLAKINPDGHFTGTFRCCIFGPHPTTVKIPAHALLPGPNIPDEILRLHFEFSVSPEELTPPHNTVCTAWRDGVSAIMDRSLVVTDALGDVVDPLPVITYLKSLATEKTPGGFSTRWAIAATPSTTPTSLQAELQVLPTAARALNKANLRCENCVSVQVARIPLQVDMFDGMEAAGPIPTLFATDRSAAFAALMENLSGTLEDLAKINSRFLFMEHLTMADAAAYLQGQAKKAKGAPAFQPKSDGQPPRPKRPKTASGPVAHDFPGTSSTGK